MKTVLYGIGPISSLPILPHLESMILVGLVCLIGWSLAYAVDCSTDFDQSCLSGEYDAEQAEADHKRSVERIKQNLAAREEEERRLKEERKKAEEEGRQKEQIALE